MPVKVALVRPHYESHIITPPLGLGYLSAFLKKDGVETVLLDGLRDRLSEDTLLKKIEAAKPDAVAITCLTAFYHRALSLSRRVKERGLVTILGGAHPTVLPHQTLVDSKADYVICGEGEVALRGLAKNGWSNRGITGVYSLDQCPGDEIAWPKAETVQRLDDLPFPDWAAMPPSSYPRAPHGAVVKHFPVGVIVTSRGCPYRCSFCASPRLCGGTVRFRSPENVADEIEYLVKHFAVREIHFEDDNFTLRRDHAKAVCELIIRRGLRIGWACPNGIRADTIDEELMSLMARSGCYSLAYGIESANPTILGKVHKNETLEQIRTAIDLAAKKGIACQGFFILGLPGETRETLRETIEFAKRSKLTRAQFLILDVLPGSELWQTLRGQFIPNWDKDSYREPEWLPEGLTKEALMKAQERAFLEFYLQPRRLFGLLRLVRFKQIPYLLKRMTAYRLIKKRLNPLFPDRKKNDKFDGSE